MFSIQAFIDGVETTVVEKLDKDFMQGIIAQWVSVGYQKQCEDGVVILYPAHRISHIQITESKLLTP